LEKQKTIAKRFSLEGKGLQTGKPVKVFFYPAEENEGIIFIRRDLKSSPLIRPGDMSSLAADRRSKVGKGSIYVETVEHIMAALWGKEIDNIRVELDNSEMPAADGSAKEFLEVIDAAGVKSQTAPRKNIEIKEPIWVEEKESFLGIFPYSNFKISYLLEYPVPSIGRQFFSKVIDSEIFKEEIAVARTFCLKEEAEALLKMGYGKGANYKNTLVIDKDGPLENKLRFSDEPVRHKVLDLIGDLYLLAKPLKARVIAVRSGHALNLKLVKKIKEKYL